MYEYFDEAIIKVTDFAKCHKSILLISQLFWLNTCIKYVDNSLALLLQDFYDLFFYPKSRGNQQLYLSAIFEWFYLCVCQKVRKVSQRRFILQNNYRQNKWSTESTKKSASENKSTRQLTLKSYYWKWRSFFWVQRRMWKINKCEKRGLIT